MTKETEEENKMNNQIFIPIRDDNDTTIVHWKMDKTALWLLTEEPQADGSKGRFNDVHTTTKCRVRIDGEWSDEWLCNLIRQPELWKDEQKDEQNSLLKMAPTR